MHVQDRRYHDWMLAGKTLFDAWTGYRAGQREICLWGSERDLLVGADTIRTRLGRWLRNEVWINAFRMDLADLRRAIRTINAQAPKRIVAYASSAYELARAARLDNAKLHQPQCIMTSAGTLHDFMRDEVERAFGCAVYNRYGSREVGDLACECAAHSGLHVVPALHIVELLSPAGQPVDCGQPGEVVVTTLQNYSAPLLRYRIGDVARWSDVPCHCGRGWPTLAQVEGRTVDCFQTRGGGVVVPEYIIHTVGVTLNTGQILRYQIIQEAIDRVRVLAVPASRDVAPTELVSARLRDAFQRVLGSDCVVEIEYVPEIPPPASGKHRYTICKIARADATQRVAGQGRHYA